MVHGVCRTEVKTVLTSLENALRCLRPANCDSLRVVSSSRTDASVHAFSNSCHVDIHHRNPSKDYDADLITFAVNKHLARQREDIRIVKTVQVDANFHCRRAVTCRHYLYRLAVGPEGWSAVHPQSPAEFNLSHAVTEPFDMEAVHAAARLMSGTHDFTAFTSPVVIEKECKDPVKTMSVGIRPGYGFLCEYVLPYQAKPQIWEFHFKSNAFLYKQIRRMMGVLVLVGKGRLRIEDVQFLLDNPRNQTTIRRHLALPGHGLSLVSVEYDESVLDPKSLLPTHGKQLWRDGKQLWRDGKQLWRDGKQLWRDEQHGVTRRDKPVNEMLLETLERRYTQLLQMSRTDGQSCS